VPSFATPVKPLPFTLYGFVIKLSLLSFDKARRPGKFLQVNTR
jgi:hypothetical protein